MATVFIDGQAGTTGLQITERLQSRADLQLIYLDDQQRKDAARRQECLQSADISILCLPDDAALEAVELAQGHGRIIDASTAHRVDSAWDYGLAELSDKQRSRITQSSRVSNPGCYPQGFILLIRPLIECGMLAASTLLRCNAVSGYSGGGKAMIAEHQAFTTEQSDTHNSQLYALTLEHKHVPEMHSYSTTETQPIFAPMVANYYQGMLVQVPLFRSELRDQSSEEVHQVLTERYAHEAFIDVLPLDYAVTTKGFLNATACNGSNKIELMVFANHDQILLVARYDNLGKGAAGAAVQNLNLMLGLEEGLSL